MAGEGACAAGGHGTGGLRGREVCVAGGAWMARGEGSCMPGETATAADCTHPTGMYSCIDISVHFIHNNLSVD